MSEPAPAARRRGPQPIVTRELLIEAGRRVLASDAKDAKLADLLGLRLQDVLTESAAVLRAEQKLDRDAVSAPSFYKFFKGIEEYASDLLAEAAQADAPDPERTLAGLDRVLLEELDRATRGATGGAGASPRLFRAARVSGDARVALQAEYRYRELALVTSLQWAFTSDGVRLRADLGDDALAGLARAIVALADGFVARAVVEGSTAKVDRSAWVTAAFALIEGVTESNEPGRITDHDVPVERADAPVTHLELSIDGADLEVLLGRPKVEPGRGIAGDANGRLVLDLTGDGIEVVARDLYDVMNRRPVLLRLGTPEPEGRRVVLAWDGRTYRGTEDGDRPASLDGFGVDGMETTDA